MPDVEAGNSAAIWAVSETGAVSPDRTAFRAILRRTVEGDILPRLLMQLRATPAPARPASGAPTLPRGALERFVQLVREPHDEGGAREYLHGLVRSGHPVDVVYDDLLAPAARRMGHLWESDDCDFMEVTLACARLQRAVASLGRLAAEGGRAMVRGRAFVCGMAEDQHTLGGVLLAEVLTRDGWLVTLAPPFAQSKPTGSYDLICFSLASFDRADAAARRVAALRARHGAEAKVILGGNALLRAPDLVERLGGDGWAQDAAGAVQLARTLVSSRDAEGRGGVGYDD